MPRLDPTAPEAWQPRHVDAFTTPAFNGFVASDDHAAYLVFRGTKLDHDTGDLFQRTLQAWLANLDFAQVEERGAMVHRGYARELDGVSELLLEMARDHALGGKPLYVTGHSAGGALATLAARRLHAAGAADPSGSRVLGPARGRPALCRELPDAAAADRAPA